MNDTTPEDRARAGVIPALTPEAKHKAKIENERIKFGVTLLHSLALAVFGLGALRIALDPSAPWPGYPLIGGAIALSIVLEYSAFYLLGRLKPEN